MTLTQDGTTLKGSMKSGGVEVELDSINVSGDAITFVVRRRQRDGDIKIEYKGNVDGDRMKGTFQQGPNSIRWTAMRK